MVWVRWVIAAIAVAVLLGAWIAFANLNHAAVTKCPAGTYRLHRTCIQV